MVGVIVLKCGVSFLLARVERTYIYDLYRTLSRRLLHRLPRPGAAVRQGVELAVLARNVNVVCLAFAAGVLKPAAAIAAEAMLLVLLFAALAVYTPLAALLARRSSCPRCGSTTRLVRNRINRYGEQENSAQREKSRLVAETFRGYADIEINDAFPRMLRAFDRAMDRSGAHAPARNGDRAAAPTFTEVGLAVGMALLVAVSFGDGGQAQLLFGVFAVATLRLMPSVRGIMSGWATIRYNRYTIPILREAALHEPASAHPEVPTRETLPFEREISVRNLSFSFTEESRELFHGLTLTIRKGERIGIRGASGAGKTTLSTSCWAFTNRRREKSPSTARHSRPQTAGHGRTASAMSRSVCSSPTEHSRPTSHRASRPRKSTAGGSPKRSEAAQLGEMVIASLPWGSTPPSANAAAASRADSASASASHAPSTAAPTCFSSTRRPRRSTAAPKGDQPFDRRDRARNPGLTLLVIAHRETSLEYCDRIITLEK